jgi:endo-1,4-beta-xylanase
MYTELLTKLWDARDVANEMFNDDGTWRTSVYYNTLGPSFISVALRAARAADPKAKLYLVSV